MGQAKKKKRKRVYSPRKKRKKVTLECEGLDTDETVNWDLAALAKEATGKGEDFDSSNADLNDLPFLTVGQELEKEMKKNTLTKNLTETEIKNALNEEKLLVGTSSNFSDVWRINSNSNFNITLQKDHRVSHNNIDSNITKGQNMFPSLPAVQNNAKSVQMLSHEAPPTLTQEGQNLKGSVLKSLLMPKLKNAYKPPNPKTFSAYLPISSSISMANQRSLLKTSVKAGQKNPCVSTDAAVLVSDSKGQQYGMTFHPNSPQHLPTAYAKNNFIHFTNMSHKETDKNKIASHNRPISNFPTQMNFHQTHFPPLVDGNVKTNTTSFCNSSNKHMINEHNEYVYDMDFEIEPEKDICENLIPPTLIKEERISHEENVGNFDKEVPKINAENDSDKNPSFPVASKVSVTGHNICDSVKSSDVSSIEEVEENLPLSHYIKKFQKDGNIVTAVKKINSQNVLSQMTSSTSLMDHIPNTNAKKQLKAKQKATYSGVKSPRKKGAKNKLDLCSGSVDESCSSASVTVQANNSAFCGENKMPETSKVVRKNLNSTCVMKTENVDMHVEMSFEEDDCDKQSHMENVKDLLAFTNVQEPINCLSKNEAQSKIDSLPLLPFIKTEPIFNSECVAENTNIPDHSNDVKSTSDTLDKSHEVQKQNFTVENNAAISTKPSLKRRKRVRKGGGKKKSKAAKLDRQTNNDDKITSNENCADASVSFASELPNNNAPIVSENGNETLEKDDAIINRNICKQNNDSISTLTEDRVHSFIDEEPISTSSMNTIIEDVETKSNKNQKKKKRNRKKTSWYPKKRKSTPKKKPVGEESSELGLTEIPGEKAQTGITAENFETPSFSENNIQSKESKESNLKQAVNNVSQVLEKSQKAVSILKPQEHLQNNALSLNPKHINASKATSQEAEQVITSSSVNSTCKANNSTELSTGSDRSQVSENGMPLRSVSIDEFRQTLSSIKKEKDDSPKTANCNENVSNSASSQLNSQNDVVKDSSKSSDNDTAHSSLSLVNRLQSIKTEKPDKTIMQCMDNISGKAAETATATFVTNELNIGLTKNLNLSESTTSHKINQKEGGDTGLNHLIHKHDAKSTKVDKFPPKSNNSENIGQNIPYTEKNTPSTSIPISQDSALLKNLSLDTNLLEKSDFIKVLQSIKKEKVDEGKTSKIPVNNKLISCEAKPGSVLDKTESDLEKTVQCSSLKSSSHDKILCSIKKEISEAVVQSCSNSENMSKHFPEATNASNSLKHTLSSDKEMLTQDKELNSNCRETLTAKAFLEKQNLTDSQSKSSQNNQYNNNISVSSIQVKKENDRINAKATTVPMFSDLQCDHNSLSREETYNRCSSVIAEKSLPLPSENDTAIKYMKQALNGNSMLNTPESFPQFHNHLMSRSQNFTSNLHQSNEQVSFVHNNNTYSAVNEVAGIPKFNTPLILNDCSPSSQYKNVFDDSDYASDYSTPVVPYSNEPIHNPVQPVSAKCSNEFFKQMADSLESRNVAQNVYQQNNTLHAVSEEKKLELEPYPTESYEWRPMDNSLPTIEQTKNIQEATVLGPNEDNQEIAKNKSSVYVDKSNLIDISIQSAVPNVNVTELQKILELAANIGDGNQKPKEMQMYRNDQVQTEGKQGFSTSVETPFPCDITTTTTKGEENSELNSVSIACDNEQPSDVPNGSEKSKICPVSEILKNKSSINDLSNFSSHTMSDSDDEPVDNDMLVGNESCHSNVDESDTETFDNLKEDIGKQKENRNADERASPPIPQYKSKWEKIMERKALEADSKEKNKVNEHLLKDCFPVSAKISKNKKTVDLNSDLSAISEKKKKHKKSKHESKKHKSSKESKKSRSAKLKKPTEGPTPESNTKSNVSIVKTSDMKDLKKSNTSKLTENPKIYKLQKTTNKKTAIGHEKQDEQSKLSVTKHSSKEVKQKCKNKSIDDGSELFKPDPVVLKTDETNSSRRFYGKRITNRGSFLTESSDKPSKAKPVVIKKTVAKSKSVPSVRTEEYHSIIESPDVNIHSFSLMQNSKRSVISDYRNISPTCSNRPVINDYRNISPSFSNRQNMTLNPTNSFTSFDKYAYEKSQVNGFEDFRCLSPQDSLDSLPSVLKLAHDKNEKPQSQNNLRTENYLAEESFSSLSSQNSHQAPTLHSKEFEMLSNLMNFNKKPLNQSSPVFETFTFAPTSSLGNSSPFDDDSKNLMSPLFSETLNVRQSNSQSVRLNSGKCICLPPRDLKLKVGHTIIDSLNVLLLILEWNVDWLFQQKNTLDPPPISKTLHKASDKYESYEEYYNTLLPLMLLETWQRIYVSWTHLQQAHPYFCEILSYCEESSYITVECQTAYNAHDHDKSLFPEEGNIIMVKFTTKTKGVIKILGYVTSVKIRPFNAATDTKNFSNKNLKNIRDDQIHMLKLTFMGAYASDDFDRKQPIRVQVLCNIKSTLKQNDALLFVDKSPLHRNILNPLDSGLSTVTLPPRNILKEPDRVNECLKEIIKGIVSPHPIPLLTVIKLLPSSDRLLVLPHLITKMKKSYRTKVLLCTRTAKALGDVGLSLVKHQLNVVVVGKRADTHVGLRKYLLDDLAVGEINKNTDAEESLLKGNLQKEHIKPDLLIKAKQIVLTECDVILCNIRNSHDDLMAQTFYDNECIAHMCCIVDEANLCTEPETLIPLMNGISKLILIGDPDVPAKVCSKTAINLDYKRSLFHRAYDLDLISD
ncbi:uncharacterized protein LOC129220085 [Uloborus diversus]|uniref:uncharacterized protein LOC129220085 n=1 Tax=Uloborus diversus TaxID=327109 RepID=UPI002409AE49|nr:uncharacterized protein LOC129220085 [Uloborus diversus]